MVSWRIESGRKAEYPVNSKDPTADSPGPSGEERRAWLCNTDVEAEWARTQSEGQPRRGERSALFQRFEEILLPSIGPTDVAILRTAPDPQFLAYLRELELEPPEVLVARGAEQASWTSTAQLVRDDPTTIRELAARVRSGRCSVLEPFGVSESVEAVARRTGLQLTGSPAETAARVSRKSSARRLAEELGFPHPEGEVCADPGDLPKVVRGLRLAGDGCPVVVKPDLGASGRGQRIVRTDADFEALAAAVDQGELGAPGTTHVVERWYPSRSTLTYGFLVDEAGRVPVPPIVREALGGAGPRHHGYVYPASFGGSGQDALRSAAERLAEALRRDDSYVGPVRCDALVLDDGRLFPVLEINARHSFFTFVDRIHARLLRGGTGLFRWFFFRSPGRLSFHDLLEHFIGRDLLFDRRRREGLVVPIFGTVTACEALAGEQGRPPLRRLFVLVLAPSADRACAIADKLRKRLVELSEPLTT